MKEKLTVVKIGGQVIDEEQALDLFLESFSRLEGHKILVHGGGKMASALAEQMNIPQQMLNGRRVTDEASLKIITMVYAGWINKNIVARLQARHCDAVGLSGADGNLIQAHKRPVKEVDFGFVGDIDKVHTDLLCSFLDRGNSLVIAPLTHDGKGSLLNTNADSVANSIAVALADRYAVQLVYCFEKPGVLKDSTDESSCIRSIDKPGALKMEQEGTIHSGMLPKIHNALQALDAGVHKVVIGKWDKLEELVSGVSGTQIQEG
ncbi:MAG TPA: acetylglutamate kinase [Chitinophagaceae bacterium]|nr:acetylglutamate kinase [Chitinophagaceae bacterium]